MIYKSNELMLSIDCCDYSADIELRVKNNVIVISQVPTHWRLHLYDCQIIIQASPDNYQEYNIILLPSKY